MAITMTAASPRTLGPAHVHGGVSHQFPVDGSRWARAEVERVLVRDRLVPVIHGRSDSIFVGGGDLGWGCFRWWA
jgi:hypothetical protein